ncbi:DotD/TraH family lipoprotein (plasmid) [Stutzerimonas stutzeri]|uniref:DotD/TraH family lipoprotein n=1 Tax=Stutzerimonas stutzeri TaxID=316 RepID=UPI001BAE59DE|nr:DotD/TraH family lipoprotein [Stutzerimonas stutzeri]QUE78414.1 DotD/TraH family lipoprotein [Stutzerimonas stutzeri]
MDSRRLSPLLGLCAVLLTGCASSQKTSDAQTEIDRLILDSARTIQAAQADLYRAAALNKPAQPAAARITDERQPLTFIWKGDAYNLVQVLANERGYRFVVEGLRLPLPLNMDVKDQPFAVVLDQIRSQVGYRAILTAGGGALTLRYNRPQP